MGAISKRGTRFRAQIRRKGISVSKTFTTKGEAKRWMVAQESKMDRSEWHDPSLLKDSTLQAIIDHYAAHKDVPAVMRTSINNLVYLADVPLARLTPEKIAEFAQWRIETHGVKPQTVNMDIIQLGNLIKYGRLRMKLPISSDLIKDTRAELKTERLISQSAERTRRPSEAELDQLMEYWQSPGYTRFPGLPMDTLVQFAILTCMRQSEICRIQWRDLDTEKRTIVIRDRKHPTMKQGNNQVIPLLGEAFTMVQNQPMEEARIFPILPGSISQNFTRTCSKLGIVDLHFHDMRRHGCSLLLEQNYSLSEVSLVSGHRDINVLHNIYSALNPVDLHRAE